MNISIDNIINKDIKQINKCDTNQIEMHSNPDSNPDFNPDSDSDTETNTETNTETCTDTVIGIDLGTRFSCVSVWRNKRFEVINDQYGNRTIPSVVSFYKSIKLVGHNALTMKEISPANTIYDIKRIIGRRMDDPIIEQVTKLISYDIVDDQSKHHNILVQLDRKDPLITQKTRYRPEEICAHILIEIRKMASSYLRFDVKDAVITVPAYFNDSQRQATLDAGKIAGLNVLKIINEPTAAALAYGLGSKKWITRHEKACNKLEGGNIIVYDLGAGTLDVSLMNISNGVFRVLAVGGNTHLGGEDIDYVLMNFVMNEFRRQHKISELKISKYAQLKLKNSVENAKKILSSTDKAVICVDDFYQNKKLYQVLSRSQLDLICNDLFIICMRPLKDVLESANMSRYDIDDVILVGGSTRIPKIRELMLNFFKDTNIKHLTSGLNPDEVVSAGASIYGHIMTHHDDPFSENLVLLDITPLSLGVETLKKQMTVIIPRNTVIPTKKIKDFSTDTDNQDMVSIKIFEGERKLTKNNFHIGTFDLCGFDKGPRGYPLIKISFNIDINGILQVTAHEKKSNVQNSVQISSTWGAKGRLSKCEIDSIILEAESNEHMDTVYSLKVGLIHRINTICNSVLINLKDDTFSLTNADKKKIRIDIRNNLKWLKDKELSDFETDELEKREKSLCKLYSPLIALNRKSEDKFTNKAVDTNVAEVYGDDENSECFNSYEKIELTDGFMKYDKEEISELKKTIMDLGNNLISVVNNPISNFEDDDIRILTEYIESVQLWLFGTPANTSIEFVAKINEINKFTQEIMDKYESKIFEKKDNFTSRDELQITCLTLNSAIKSSFFSLQDTDNKKLIKTINKTMIWLLSHQNEDENIYREKNNEISDLCNNIYHNMHKMKILENIELAENDLSSEDSDAGIDDTNDINDTNCDAPTGNKITENIDDILKNLPSIPKNRIYKPCDVPYINHCDKPSIKPSIKPSNKPINKTSDKPSNKTSDKPIPQKKYNHSTKKPSIKYLDSKNNNNLLINNENKDDILLKIDINKLSTQSVLRYKNIEHSYR